MSSNEFNILRIQALEKRVKELEIMDLRSKDAIESSKQHDIQMGNIFIAEFMGFKEHEGSYYLPLYNGGDWVPDVELEYHTSWDWLMPVVIKIGGIENILGAMKKLRTYSKVINLEDTYQAVVEFIKNQNN